MRMPPKHSHTSKKNTRKHPKKPLQTQKNNVIIGILNCKLYPDKYIFDDDKNLSYMFPNVKTFDEKKK